MKRSTFIACLSVLGLSASLTAAQESPRADWREAPQRVGRSSANVAAAVEEAPREAILSIVTSANSPDVVLSDADRSSLESDDLFYAEETLNMFALAVFDRRMIGTEPFDQVTTFYLPDGSVYERRTTPVAPTAREASPVNRPDVADVPVKQVNMPRMRRLVRSLPDEAIEAHARRHATFTSEKLPVDGTWITKHNLYGTWTVEISLVRQGHEFASKSAKFEILSNR